MSQTHESTLSAIASAVERDGWPPTLDELAQATGRCKTSVRTDVAVLIAMGRLVRGTGMRQLRVMPEGIAA